MPRRTPGTYTGLEDLGRVRLSPYFYMRDFLYSEIGNFFGKPNLPVDPDLAIAAGKKLCAAILDPMTETFGPLHIRSSYRSPDLNHFGATEVKPQKCARNEANYAGHIWDIRDAKGRMGATASIAVPWFADQFEKGRDWRDLAWWIHDHLDYHQLYFFPKLAAFNVTWRQAPERSILSYVAPRGKLYADGQIPPEPAKTRKARYADFPPFKGISYPKVAA
ncbi:hypothetical protein [Boseongicola aestuarii]|jgi:hypothetical protein|uniref:Peptidase M15 n=1 Tax=Boseongicola aestuarii TaxID=1470561 RepID=A0A238IZI8_9RHOB|nr:hypothetical protein [Boseongicola aestuarii]SMX23412.1 hypothetical protein BOA8489_01519 [Boseongicola aestuarii]